MKHNANEREKQQALDEERRQTQARDDLQATKDQDFYTRLGLHGPDEDRPEDTFLISVYSEHWTHEDLEAGETNTRDIELDRVVVDADDLERHGQDYGLSELSCSDPRMSPDIWFSSTHPRQDRAYFEQGVQKYYSLHVHEVNGKRPTPEDYQRVGDLIGASFDHALRPSPQHEQEGPDLCL
ncbi:hypothetical protein GSY71_10380 [Pusillimonas sp. TS35]|uniref:hypothetical protein n=1 Tax=Paracandidimonas lactea TaxID=2895524 RepID=UPI00136E72A4|nr:hypothetical protein [Paracandidimonas lactea]MYN13541.1 hypothetical protein [Pusillimonas sp. TS35]